LVPPQQQVRRYVFAMSFSWRIFAVNAVVFALGAAALALSPATVSFPIILAEALVLAGGLAAILLLNLFLVRRSFAPLRRLMVLMRRVDLLRPGERLRVSGPPEVRELGSVFNEMVARLESERRESGRETLTRHEEERRVLARELHDEIGQAMTGVMLTLSRAAARAPAELRTELVEAREAARSTLDDVRRVARQLRPEALDDLGLIPALNALAVRFERSTGLAVECRFEQNLPRLTADGELAIYRIAQESLTNTARHAGARSVELRLECTGGALRLSVRDDGRGLRGARFGTGIRGMRERALLVGGELEFRAPPGAGAEVLLTVPCVRS
jgi:two-component system sensor histidine kinase UhpB